MAKTPLTTTQVAALPGMASTRTLQRRIQEGKIPGAIRQETTRGPVYQIPNTKQALKACKHRPPGRFPPPPKE